MSVLRHFDWKKIAVIYEKKATTDELYNAIKQGFEAENELFVDPRESRLYSITNVSHVAYPFSEVSPTETEKLRDIIQETKDHSRSMVMRNCHEMKQIVGCYVCSLVYVTFGNVRMFRRILFLMGSSGMMDTGDYVIIYLDTDFYWLDVYDAMNNHFFRGSSLK